ncbi:unnamed protein product [Malus baccata var. baccata]
MKTIFRSHDLWDMVKKGYNPPVKNEEGLNATELKLLKEYIVKDAKALGIIQGAVTDEIFPWIAILETAKEAWDVLNLPKSYDSIVAVIENTRDLETFDVQDVVAVLKGYEQWIERHSENDTKKAFSSLSIAPRKSMYIANQHFKTTKNWKTKGKKWDRKLVHQQGKSTGSSDGAKNPCKYCDKLNFGECWFKGKPRCHNCDKPGHFAKDCRTKKFTLHANYVNQVENNPTMFYVCTSAAMKKDDDIWYIDSGCSNHMTGRENLLVNIDRNVIAKVEMGTGQLVNVVGK